MFAVLARLPAIESLKLTCADGGDVFGDEGDEMFGASG